MLIERYTVFINNDGFLTVDNWFMYESMNSTEAITNVIMQITVVVISTLDAYYW
jgi:hypothetical protein